MLSYNKTLEPLQQPSLLRSAPPRAQLFLYSKSSTTDDDDDDD